MLALNHKQNALRNKSIILEGIRRRGPIERAQLSRLTGLSLPTMSKFVSLLEEDGVVLETGPGDAPLGRKPLLLGLRPDVATALGMEIGSAYVRAVLMDAAGTVVARHCEPSHHDRETGSTVCQAIGVARRLMDEASTRHRSICGIGLGISAITDAEGDLLSWPWRFSQGDTDIRAQFITEFGLPVEIEDSNRTAAVAVRRLELRNDVDNLVYLGIGAGVGTGVFLNGSLMRGSGGLAGELGHTTVDENGPLCKCGNYGCLESLVSAPAIVLRAETALRNGVISSLRLNGERIQLEDIASAAAAGDKLAYEIIATTARYIGIGVANIINIFNPRSVILGGGVARISGVLLEHVKQTVRLRGLPAAVQQAEVRLTELGEDVGALGAAIVALDGFFAEICSNRSGGE